MKCLATLTAYDAEHVCRQVFEHDGWHRCDCGTTWPVIR